MLIIGINYEHGFSWSRNHNASDSRSAAEQLTDAMDGIAPDEIIFIGVDSVYVASEMVKTY